MLTSVTLFVLLASATTAVLVRRDAKLTVGAFVMAMASVAGVKRGTASVPIIITAYGAYLIAFAATVTSLLPHISVRPSGVWGSLLAAMLGLGGLAAGLWLETREIALGAFVLIFAAGAAFMVVVNRPSAPGAKTTTTDR